MKLYNMIKRASSNVVEFFSDIWDRYVNGIYPS